MVNKHSLPTYDHEPYKFVVLGDAMSGKTTLIGRAVTGAFNPKYDATIKDSFRKDFQLSNGTTASIEIIDTSGSEQFHHLADEAMREAHALILTYSTTSLASFHAVQTIYDQIVEAKQTSIPIVLIGSKCDLEHKRELSITEGQKLARKWNCLFMETSARSGINHAECFVSLADLVQKQRYGIKENTFTTLSTLIKGKRFLSSLRSGMRKTSQALLRVRS